MRMKKVLIATYMLLTGSLYAQVATNYEIGTWSQFKTASVSYTMDDNCTNQIPVALPLFDKYNYKVTFFTVINWSPNWSGLLAASKNGHEVGSHTMTHPTSLATLSLADQNTELQQSQATINSNITNAKCVTLAYPNCNRGDLATTQKYYIAARVCSGTVEAQTPADFYNISSIITGNTGNVQTAADLNSKVAAAKSSKGWCVFLTHGIDNDGGYSPTQSAQIASHLTYMNTNSADFWVAPFGTVVKYIKERNAASVTETTITSDSLKVVVADNLDNTIYNVPITIRRVLPTGWQNPKVYLNSTLITSSLSTVSGKTYIVFDAVPNQGTIFLANKSTSTNPGNPVVSLTAPLNGATYAAGASITLTATATDPNGTVSSVKFYNGSTLLSTVTTAPYTYTWTNVAVGNYSVTAVATDNSGNTTTSSAASITVGSPTKEIGTNGEFDNGTTGWTLQNNSGATGTMSVVTNGNLSGTNSLRICPSTNPGTLEWHVQVSETTPITSGKNYLITVMAKADAARTMSVAIQESASPYTTYFAQTVNLTTAAQTFTFSYNSTVTDATAQLKFYVGANTSCVNIDKVSMLEGAFQLTSTITAASDTTFCTGGSVVLNASTGTGYTYQWLKGGTAITGATGATYTATTAGSYSVAITANSQTVTSAGMLVTVNTLPTATITAAGATSFCTGGSVVLNANTGTGLTYQWKNAAGVITGATGASYTATAADSYTITVTNGSNCSATSAATAVTVNTLPTASITAAGATTFCTGGNVVLNANTGSGLTYQWKNAAGVITGATGASYTATTADSYTVTVSNNSNCSATSTATTVAVNTLPTATITAAGTTSFCTGGSVVLNANTGSGLTYQWKNAAGVITGATGASYTATAAGSYTVTVSNNSNCSATSAATAVTVNTLPTATITAAGATTFCTGGSVVLNANTGTGLTYQWKNAAGVITGATGASYTATAAGSYTVTVTNNSNCSATSTSTTVTVNTLPTATITAAGATTFCTGGSVVLNANTGSGLTYQWKNAAGVITGATGASYTATAAGSYTVTVTNNSNCSATSTATTVTVNTLPTATITAASTSFCTGGSVVLNANTGTGLTYQWKNAAGVITGATGANYTATAAGSYTVTVSSGNCSATSASTAVTVNTLPTATITAAGATSFCTGGSVVLNANTGSGFTYQWSNAAGTIAGATGSSYTATTADSYTVTVSNNSNCSATSASTAVTVNALPTATITAAGTTSFCTGGSVVLNANTGSGLTYQWKNAAGVITGATGASYTATAAGSYTVTVSSGNCSATSASTAVTVNTLPTAAITAAATSFCAGGSVVLNANAGSGLTYQWSNAAGVITGATGASYTATVAGSYAVTVSSGNCSSTSSAIAITVSTALTWYQDTDGDGKGDPAVTQTSCTQPTGYVSVSGDGCPNDPNKVAPGICGCGNAETDTDGDGTPDCTDTDDDNDGVLDSNDCAPLDASIGAATVWYQDTDGDGAGDPSSTLTACTQPTGYVSVAGDGCPTDPDKTSPGICGCGKAEGSCTTTGIQTSLSTSVEIYPNPSETDFTIVAGTGNFTVTFYNTSGLEVLKGVYDSEARVGSELSQGMYLIRIEQGGMTETRKIIKK